jgi:hypothetical protein
LQFHAPMRVEAVKLDPHDDRSVYIPPQRHGLI